MKSLKARQAEREERQNKEERIAARSALANKKPKGGEEYQIAELDPNKGDEENGENGENGGGETPGEGAEGGAKPKGGKGATNWTPNA